MRRLELRAVGNLIHAGGFRGTARPVFMIEWKACARQGFESSRDRRYLQRQSRTGSRRRRSIVNASLLGKGQEGNAFGCLAGLAPSELRSRWRDSAGSCRKRSNRFTPPERSMAYRSAFIFHGVDGKLHQPFSTMRGYGTVPARHRRREEIIAWRFTGGATQRRCMVWGRRRTN